MARGHRAEAGRALAAPMVGGRFGMLVVISVVDSPKRGTHVLVRCDCGRELTTAARNVRNGHTRSCGCTHPNAGTHRSTGTITYESWRAMRERCTNPNNRKYADYGGRGIRICERWSDFSMFLLDMGEGPSRAHTIDRINNDGDYEPGNCRWATRQEQVQNTRRTKLNADVVAEIRRQVEQGASIPHLAKDFGVDPNTIRAVVSRASWGNV